MRLVIRWQIGDHPEMSWRALRLSVHLMQRLEPNADFIVVHQGPPKVGIDGVTWCPQGNLYSCGRFERPFAELYDGSQHEVTMENDHIIWELPPAWLRWKQRDDANLVWIVDWSYYADAYASRVGDFLACPGMYGLKPGDTMPGHGYQGEGIDMVEQGHVAAWLREHPPHEIVTHDEVAAYMPNHDILKHTHSKLGTHGVHLPGLNRGWSRGGEQLIEELERKYL
jgi:hypothetical protein